MSINVGTCIMYTIRRGIQHNGGTKKVGDLQIDCFFFFLVLFYENVTNFSVSSTVVPRLVYYSINLYIQAQTYKVREKCSEHESKKYITIDTIFFRDKNIIIINIIYPTQQRIRWQLCIICNEANEKRMLCTLCTWLIGAVTYAMVIERKCKRRHFS